MDNQINTAELVSETKSLAKNAMDNTKQKLSEPPKTDAAKAEAAKDPLVGEKYNIDYILTQIEKLTSTDYSGSFRALTALLENQEFEDSESIAEAVESISSMCAYIQEQTRLLLIFYDKVYEDLKKRSQS